MVLKSKGFAQLLIILLILAAPTLAPAVTPPLPAHPREYVVDLAGVLDAGSRARLNGLLKDLEAATTAQMVVLTINSLEGQPLEEFSHQTAVKWGIGQKGKDNGVLFTLALKEKKYRFEVGYGLESVLPDSLVGSIGRQYLVPHFRKGDFSGGIIAATSEIVRIISRGQVGSQAGATAGGGQEDARPKSGPGGSGIDNVVSLVVIIAFIIIGLGVMAFVIPWLIRRATGGVWFSGGSGGGWSSGGGDSGFSGGGGDFGGGGASGDW